MTFVAVVDAGSFTRGGERLHRTQSAVSMQIGQLEEALGEAVLVRDRNGVRPTLAGERLLPSARRMVQAWREAQLAAGTPAAAHGPLRVGIPEEYTGSDLPELLTAFQRTQPTVTLEVVCEAGDRLNARLAAGELDIGLVVADRTQPGGATLMYDPTIWAVAETTPLPLEEPLPLVVFDQACWWRTWVTDMLNQAGREWRIVYTSPSIAGVAAAIRAGLGVGVLGRTTLPEGVRAVPEAETLPALPGSHLVLRIEQPAAPGVAIMAELMREHFSA